MDSLYDLVKRKRGLTHKHSLIDTLFVWCFRQIEELTQQINKLELQINDHLDENEDLRERLGLDPKEPLSLAEFKKKKGSRLQEDRALNRVLQKEVIYFSWILYTHISLT